MQKIASLSLFLLGSALGACGQNNAPSQNNTLPSQTSVSTKVQSTAKATIVATSGSSLVGEVVFTAQNEGVEVSVQIKGLSEGDHGFHIHEHGDCSSPDGKSAGGHFNPGKVEHGGPMATRHHGGDLGNLSANAQGIASTRFSLPFLSLTGEHSIVGRAVIVHAKSDDLTTQPTGAAGARLGCGVIKAIAP